MSSFQIDVRLRECHEEDSPSISEYVVVAAGCRVEVVTRLIPSLFEARSPFKDEDLLARRMHVTREAGVGFELEESRTCTCGRVAAEQLPRDPRPLCWRPFEFVRVDLDGSSHVATLLPEPWMMFRRRPGTVAW